MKKWRSSKVKRRNWEKSSSSTKIAMNHIQNQLVLNPRQRKEKPTFSDLKYNTTCKAIHSNPDTVSPYVAFTTVREQKLPIAQNFDLSPPQIAMNTVALYRGLNICL
jgi:hypothetical protein